MKSNPKTISESDPLSKEQKFAYAIGQIPQSIFYGIFSIMYIEFFWEDLDLSYNLAVAGLIVYATINAANDPFFGYITDKTDVDRWGSRRLIYIKWGSVVWVSFHFFQIQIHKYIYIF